MGELTISPWEETHRPCDVGPGQPPGHQGMTDSNICHNCSIQRMHYALRGQAYMCVVCVCVYIYMYMYACVCVTEEGGFWCVCVCRGGHGL